ncbi:MAG: hypothetical protein C4523_12645 [Myxococcales bacterium]|nr:MAG: hypothetical protein C4523_12645 [Myxococcales bacterium]
MKPKAIHYEIRWAGKWWDPWTWNTWHVFWVGDFRERVVTEMKGRGLANETRDIMEKAFQRAQRRSAAEAT